MTPRHLFATTVTGIEAGCIAGVLFFGARILPADAAPSQADAAEPRSEALAPDSTPATDEAPTGSTSVLWSEEPVASPRLPCAADASTVRDAQLDSKHAVREKRSERDYYADFRARGARDAHELESAARRVLAANGPDCEKVAVLRAACDARCSSAFDLLAEAALELPNACRTDGDSVPRFAVRLLVDKSPREDRARLALERLAWNASLASDLRCMAATGLASAADESAAWRIVSRLAIEQDVQVRAGALEALARNPAAQSARTNAAPWSPPMPDGSESSPQSADAGQQQE